MRRFILLFSILACMQVNAEIKSFPLNQLINAHTAFCKLDRSKPACCPVYYPIGPKGARGCKGERGRQGPRGRAGSSLEINNFIEVTTVFEGLIFDSDFISFDPISTTISGLNGIQASIPSAMALVESSPGSGYFDTITLPIESEPTLYVVTHGASVNNSLVDFQLVLNGMRLPYTDLSLSFEPNDTMFSRTSVILNPANTAGTLNVVAICYESASLESPLEGGFSAYVTVVKLNNLGT